MQQSSINIRAVIVYGLVGLIILALIITGIAWAKSRSDQYASQQGQTVAENGQQQEQSPQDSQQPGGESTPHTDGAHVDSAAVTGPDSVPAAGAGDWLWLTLAASAATYVIARLVQPAQRPASTR